jgi:hypothetical protein
LWYCSFNSGHWTSIQGLIFWFQSSFPDHFLCTSLSFLHLVSTTWGLWGERSLSIDIHEPLFRVFFMSHSLAYFANRV